MQSLAIIYCWIVIINVHLEEKQTLICQITQIFWQWKWRNFNKLSFAIVRNIFMEDTWVFWCNAHAWCLMLSLSINLAIVSHRGDKIVEKFIAAIVECWKGTVFATQINYLNWFENISICSHSSSIVSKHAKTQVFWLVICVAKQVPLQCVEPVTHNKHRSF